MSSGMASCVKDVQRCDVYVESVDGRVQRTSEWLCVFVDGKLDWYLWSTFLNTLSTLNYTPHSHTCLNTFNVTLSPYLGRNVPKDTWIDGCTGHRDRTSDPLHWE